MESYPAECNTTMVMCWFFINPQYRDYLFVSKFFYKFSWPRLIFDPRINPNKHEHLQRAAIAGRMDVVQLLLSHPDINPHLGYMAAAVGNLAILNVILQHPNCESSTVDALRMATVAEQYPTMTHLLSKYPTLDPTGAIQIALRDSSIKPLEFLLAHPVIIEFLKKVYRSKNYNMMQIRADLMKLREKAQHEMKTSRNAIMIQNI